MTQISRQEAEALLVFYANGSLIGQERDLVEQALESDAELREELNMIAKLRAEMQSAEPANPGDTAYYRLMKEVEKTPQDVPPKTGAVAKGRISLSRAVLVLAMLALLVQSFVLWGMRDAEFSLASGGEGAELTVAFRPDASEAAIRSLLLELDLQIVSGPSSLGLYRLSSENPDQSVDALRVRSDVVESAENAND